MILMQNVSERWNENSLKASLSFSSRRKLSINSLRRNADATYDARKSLNSQSSAFAEYALLKRNVPVRESNGKIRANPKSGYVNLVRYR
jgi:hypothetical protein